VKRRLVEFDVARLCSWVASVFAVPATRRRIVILAMLALGFMFGLTGAVVGISRLRATLPIAGRH
jgi:hypothetical protein